MDSITRLHYIKEGGSEGGLYIAWSSAKPNVGAGKHIRPRPKSKTNAGLETRLVELPCRGSGDLLSATAGNAYS